MRWIRIYFRVLVSLVSPVSLALQAILAYSSSSISNFSNSAVCNPATIASTELCELVFSTSGQGNYQNGGQFLFILSDSTILLLEIGDKIHPAIIIPQIYILCGIIITALSHFVSLFYSLENYSSFCRCLDMSKYSNHYLCRYPSRHGQFFYTLVLAINQIHYYDHNLAT